MKAKIRTFIGWLAITITIQIVYFWVLYRNADTLFPSKTVLERLGLFGDMFGGMTALFSAVAAAGLIYTVLVQRSEIKFQETEAAKTATAQASIIKVLLASAELNALSSQLQSSNLEYYLMIREDFPLDETEKTKAEIDRLRHEISVKVSAAAESALFEAERVSST